MSQGAALGAMVGFLTYGNKKFRHLDAQMRKLLEPLYRTMKELIPFVDADAAAFNDYMVRHTECFEGVFTGPH